MSAIAQKILTEGLASVKVDMLPPEVKRKLMKEAGDKLLHAGKLDLAAGAYALGNCTEELRGAGQWFVEQFRLSDAAMFLVHVGKPDELEDLAHACVAAGEIEVAKRIYTLLGQTQMVQFLDENFKSVQN